MGHATKLDEFSERFKTAVGPPMEIMSKALWNFYSSDSVAGPFPYGKRNGIRKLLFNLKEENKGKNRPLNDQKWVLQRKRIRLSNMSQIKDQTYSYNHSPSLSRKSMKTLQAAIKSQKNKLTVISFIETHFKRKEFIIILYTLLSNLVHRDPHCARRNFS